MKNIFYFLALVALAGCSVQVRDERVVNVVGVGIFTGLFVGNAIEESRNPRPMPDMSAFDPWLRTPEPAPLAPDRKVSEQDCTKPVDTTLGNLRCK
jgi:hypothetical protein